VTTELSRIVRIDGIGAAPRREVIAATPAECAALAARFDLQALDRLTADLTVVRDVRGVAVAGRLSAAGAQACVVSAEPVPFLLDEAVDLVFSDAAVGEAAEIELEDVDLDVLPLDGDALDLGEAVAQSLGLALDPYPRAPDDVRAAAARFVVSEAEATAAAEAGRANPFAVLRPRG